MTQTTRLNEIKARLNSVGPTAMAKLPSGVKTLLTIDVPWLIARVEAENQFADWIRDESERRADNELEDL